MDWISRLIGVRRAFMRKVFGISNASEWAKPARIGCLERRIDAAKENGQEKTGHYYYY